jgi:hypothetical protein
LNSAATSGGGRADPLGESMGSPPRTRQFFRPILEDICRTAAAWKNRIRFVWFSKSRLARLFLVLSCVLTVVLAVCISVAMYIDANTAIRREVTTDATWHIRHDGLTHIVDLSFPEFPDFAEEAVLSDRLEEHLKTRNPATVRATMVVVYDFDKPTTKGPTLVVDGIHLDE